MYIVIFASLFALFLSYLDSKKRMKGGMLLGFIIMTVIEAIHYNYGNDYMSYYYEYLTSVNLDINWGAFIDSDYVGREPGWEMLNIVFGRLFGAELGFFAFVAVMSVVQNVIYYRFIKKNAPQNYWYLGVFIYLFSAYELYVINMSMLRQGFAIALFVGAFSFIKDRRVLLAILLILFASTLHKSALIMLPFAFWGFLPQWNRKIVVVAFMAIFLLFLISSEILGDVLIQLQAFSLIDDYVQGYTAGSESRGLGFIIRILPFIVYLYILSSSKINLKNTDYLLITLAAVSFLIEPFTNFGVLFIRISYYFVGLSMAAIPVAVSYIRHNNLKVLFVISFLFITLYMYFSFFRIPLWAKHYTDYHTIFEVIF